MRAVPVLLVLLLFASCSDDNQKTAESTCEIFFRKHPERMGRFFFSECLDSNRFHYELALSKGNSFFAEIENDEIRTKYVMNYFASDFSVEDFSTWERKNKSENFDILYADKKNIVSDTNCGYRFLCKKGSFEEFREFAMAVDRLDSNEFYQKFEQDDSLANLFKNMRSIFILDGAPWIRKINDSLFFVQRGRFGDNFVLEVANIRSKKSRKILSFMVACCNRGSIGIARYVSDIRVTNSSLYVEFFKEHWLFYDLFRDSLTFHFGESEVIGSYFIDHYRVQGDTMHHWNFEKLTPLEN